MTYNKPWKSAHGQRALIFVRATINKIAEFSLYTMVKIVDMHIKKKLQGGCINVICMLLTKVVACTLCF